MRYEKDCIVYRNQTVLNEYNNPVQTLVLQGEYKVRISKSKPTLISLQVQYEMNERYVLYARSDANLSILANDILEVDGERYIAMSKPLKYTHHYEVSITRATEV